MNKKNKRFLKPLSFSGIIISIFMMTIGYSAFNSRLTISGEAAIKINNNIAIIDLNVSSVENGAYEQYNSSFGNKIIDYNIVLPNENSTITYKIDIKNKTDKDYGISSITGLPSNVTYEFINYNLGEKICTNSTCNNGEVDEIYLKIKYKSNGYDNTNVNFSGRIKVNFEYFYDVIYRNVANSNTLKQKVLKGTTYQEIIPIPVDNKIKVRMNGVLLVKDNNYFYDTNTNQLTIPDVSANIVISIEEIGTEFELTGTGGKNPFSYLNTGFDMNEKTFYIEADLSTVNLAEVFENIISIGNNINIWEVGQSKPRGANLHVFYPSVANTTGITIDVTYTSDTKNEENKYIVGFGKFQKILNLPSTKLLRLAFNSNGLYINGEKIFDENGKAINVSTTIANPTVFLETYFDIWRTTTWNVDIGSTEGNNRSNAIYNEIKIYNNLLTAEELIDITAITIEETPIEEEITYDSASAVTINSNPSTAIIYPFQPNNNKFIFTSPNLTDLNNNSLYLEMDVSNLKQGAKLENLISIGNSIPSWTAVGAYNFHIFYPDTDNQNKIILALLNQANLYGQFRSDISLIDDKYIKMVLCRNGLYINGEKWLDPTGFVKTGLTAFGTVGSHSSIVSTMFDKFTNIIDNTFQLHYGSQQGDNQSSATYNDIRIYNGVLSDSQSITLTS